VPAGSLDPGTEAGRAAIVRRVLEVGVCIPHNQASHCHMQPACWACSLSS
jgi:hypothetical protein